MLQLPMIRAGLLGCRLRVGPAHMGLVSRICFWRRAIHLHNDCLRVLWHLYRENTSLSHCRSSQEAKLQSQLNQSFTPLIFWPSTLKDTKSSEGINVWRTFFKWVSCFPNVTISCLQFHIWEMWNAPFDLTIFSKAAVAPQETNDWLANHFLAPGVVSWFPFLNCKNRSVCTFERMIREG